MSPYALDITEADFDQQVIEASKTTPVVIDFWAEWCGPCRVLKPMLEKLAEEYQGKFILAKVDSDENARIAGRFAVRGIPTVVAVVNGEEVDRFSGAIPEGQVRKFLDKLIPSPAAELRRQATEAYHGGDTQGALALLAQASQLAPEDTDTRLLAAEILLHSGNPAEARQLVDSLPPLVRMEDKVVTLLARLDFAEKGQSLPGADDLQARLQADENDLEARLQLANLYVSREQYDPALEQLLEIVKRDRAFQEDVGRKTMLQVFNLLGGEGEVVSKYRKLLASALY